MWAQATTDSCRQSAAAAGPARRAQTQVSARRVHRLNASETDLEVVSNHHLEHEEQLSIRDEAVSVHVVHLECDCRRGRRAMSTGLL